MTCIDGPAVGSRDYTTDTLGDVLLLELRWYNVGLCVKNLLREKPSPRLKDDGI